MTRLYRQTGNQWQTYEGHKGKQGVYQVWHGIESGRKKESVLNVAELDLENNPGEGSKSRRHKTCTGGSHLSEYGSSEFPDN